MVLSCSLPELKPKFVEERAALPILMKADFGCLVKKFLKRNLLFYLLSEF